MRISEKKAVEDPTLRKCRKLWPGLMHRKMNGMGFRSWPDQMFMIPGGKPFYIEFKSPGEVPTTQQAEMIERMKGDGYDVEIHDDKDQAVEAIRARMQAYLRDATRNVRGPKAR